MSRGTAVLVSLAQETPPGWLGSELGAAPPEDAVWYCLWSIL